MAKRTHDSTKRNEKKYENGEESPVSYGYGVRHVQMFVVWTSLCVLLIARAYISVTIVAMTDIVTKPTHIDLNENIGTSNTDVRPIDNIHVMRHIQENQTYSGTTSKAVNSTEIVINETDISVTIIEELKTNESNNISSPWNVYRTYAWPKATQELVLGAFFVGYMTMMTPMGLVCQRWGGKLALQIGLFTSAIITCLTPWLAVWGDWKAVCLSRLVMGFLQAGTYPSVHTLLAKWVPTSELGRLSSYVYTGSMVGSILSSHMSGVLASSRLGWPAVCWSVGALCLLAGLLLSWLVASSPHHHRSISHQEQTFILGGVKDQTERRYKTPWKAIMTSKHTWACFFAHIGTSTCHLFFFIQIPTYLHYVVGLDIKSSGLLTALPYLANFLMSVCIGILSDYCVNNNILGMNAVRIISNCTASVGPAVGLFALSFISNAALAVSCLVFCVGTLAGTHTGWMVNYIELAPRFSGALMATGNTLANVTGPLLSVLVSNIVTDMTDVRQWRIVLFVVGTLTLITNALFVAMMTTDLQPWNDAAYTTTGREDPDLLEGNKTDQIEKR